MEGIVWHKMALARVGYMDDVPLDGPKAKNKNCQKVVREWFWAFPNDMPKQWSKSAQKVVQKWPQQDLGTKNCPKSCKKVVKNV